MVMTIQVDIVSAERAIFSGQATIVVANAALGEVGITPQHAQMLTTLKPGSIRVVLSNGGEEIFYVNGGILEVQPHTITILADTAIRADELDEAAAHEAKERAQQALAAHKGAPADLDYARAAAELAESIAQIQTIRNLRKKLTATGS